MSHHGGLAGGYVVASEVGPARVFMARQVGLESSMNCIVLAGLGLLLLTLVQSNGASGREATTRLSDFDHAQANARWRVVNDNVMGGRSKGDVRFADGVMTFFGDINTNGGGFASVRLPIERGTLAGVERMVMRLKHDGRVPYRVLVIDAGGRPRGILHQLELAFDGPAGEWEMVTVDLGAMQPTFRGEPVDAAPLDPAEAVEIGFILNDTGDGPFELHVDWIDVVR